MEDIWSQNAAIIKQLYQDEHRTLKDVKRILEHDHGFPPKPLSIYVARLRDLGLRKKLKKGDYATIHHFAQSHGYSTYDVYLNDTWIPWIKVWKEIRRSGATKPGNQATINVSSLPPGVKLLPKAEEEPAGTTRLESSHLGHNPLVVDSSLILHDSPESQTQSRFEAGSALIPLSSGSRSTATMQSLGLTQPNLGFGRLALENLPWHDFRQTLLTFLINEQPRVMRESADGTLYLAMSNDGFFKYPYAISPAKVSDTVYPTYRSFELIWQSAGMLSSKRDTYLCFASLVYLISNGPQVEEEDSWYKRMFDLMGQVLRKMSPDIALRLFKSNVLSMRGLWDQLMLGLQSSLRPSYTYRLPETTHLFPPNTALFISVTMSLHPEWITGHEDHLLQIAAAWGDHDLVAKLLQLGANQSHTFNGKTATAITYATVVGAHDCVQLVIDTCDVNEADVITTDGRDRPKFLTSNFVHFWSCAMFELARTGSEFRSEEPLSDGKFERIIHTLDVFLNNGADVDVPCPSQIWADPDWCSARDWESDGQPSCLDFSFYWCRPVFERMKPWSLKCTSDMSREGICTAAARGGPVLIEYLAMHDTYSEYEKTQFLESILEELISMRLIITRESSSRIGVSNPRVAKVLMECGIALPKNRSPDVDNARSAALVWLSRIRHAGLMSDMLSVLELLFRQLTVIDSTLLEGCVQRVGVEVFQSLAKCKPEFHAIVRIAGGCALRRAAKVGNREAVSLLLRLGVDINSTLPEVRVGWSTTVIGAVLFPCYANKDAFAMCQFLIEHGAKPRWRHSDNNIYGFLWHVLLYYPDYFIELMLSLQGQENELDKISQEQWNELLRAATWGPRYLIQPSSSRNFNFIRKKFCQPQAALGLLARVILIGYPPELIQELIQSGADVNGGGIHGSPLHAAVMTLNVALTRQLLTLGADADGSSVMRHYGTPLSTVFSVSPSPLHDEIKRKAIIDLLLKHHADVDGRADAPCWYHGDGGIAVSWYRPLQFCAIAGNLEDAALLIDHKANPNLLCVCPQEEFLPQTALDLAVRHRRVDMTQFLLNVGGLSATPGLTGYDGAIEVAHRIRNSAIAELLQRHINQSMSSELVAKRRIVMDNIVRETNRLRLLYEADIKTRHLLMC